MIRLSRSLMLSALASVAVLSGCGDKKTITSAPPPPPSTGSLDVRVVGLPPGANGSVNITGPNGFTRALAASEVIGGLTPGAYTITAVKVTASGDSFDPTPATQTATVAANAPTTANISYLVTTSRLLVNVNGLPTVPNPVVRVTGPNDYSRALSASEELIGLTPGTYRVAGENVVIGGGTYAPTPAAVTLQLTPSIAAVQTTIGYALITGSLEIVLNGVPLGFTPSVAIRKPDGTSITIDRSQVLTALTPGDYTVTAAPATDGQNTYLPNPANIVIKVDASLIATRLIISYGASTGSINLALENLPAGIDSRIVITGPNNFTTTVSAARTVAGLAAGVYTVNAPPVGTTALYLPTPENQTVTVTAGRTTNVAIVYTALPVVPAELRLLGAGFLAPRQVVSRPGDSRLFIVERTGTIRIVNGAQPLAVPFLNISNKVVFSLGDDTGLLSLAFDPSYSTNGFFYVMYVTLNGDLMVERLSVSAGNPDIANPNGTPVLTIPRPGFVTNYGGHLVFGPDRLLYIAVGDGGGQGDPSNNGQSLASLLGKVLRIDVANLPYTIPLGNPYASFAGRKPEIWAYGLRNPRRMSFDPIGTALHITDSGERLFEEVNASNRITGGQNFGWDVMEGNECAVGTGCVTTGMTLPLFQYARSTTACGIVGGSVYRGTMLPQLTGQYVFSDQCSGVLKSVRLPAASSSSAREIGNLVVSGGVAAIGETVAGEVLVLSRTGNLYALLPTAAPPAARRR